MSLSAMLANVIIDRNFASRKHKAAALTLKLASKKASSTLIPKSILITVLICDDRFVVGVR